MKERPILFKEEMVRAILEGRKTQTRRLNGLAKINENPDMWRFDGFVGIDNIYAVFCSGYDTLKIKCPFGMPGDKLWVKETFRLGAWREDGRMALDYKASPEIKRTPWITIPEENDIDGNLFNSIWMKACEELEQKNIKADENGHYSWEPGKSPLKWKPSIFMPRWASRINPDVIDIRMERLQDINALDITCEGVEIQKDWFAEHAMEAFKSLWDLINEKSGYGWDRNPWVWVVEFRRVK